MGGNIWINLSFFVENKYAEITKEKNRIVVVNKKDLDTKIDYNHLGEYVLISAYDENDIDLLQNKIKEICNLKDLNNIDGTYIGNARQIAKLKDARNALNEALKSLENGYPVDIANIDINIAWTSLGEIMGEVSGDDMLDELFSRFCLGK